MTALTRLSRSGYGHLPVTTPDPGCGTAMDLMPPVLRGPKADDLTAPETPVVSLEVEP